MLDYQINDVDEVSFSLVVSCKKLLQLNLESLVCNEEVTGHTDYNKQFHPTEISVST